MQSSTKDGAQLITDERHRQVEHEEWTHEHDDTHTNGDIAQAAACYALNPDQVVMSSADSASYLPIMRPGQIRWPWSSSHYKPGTDRIRALVKSGALIAAEIDRLIRLQQP